MKMNSRESAALTAVKDLNNKLSADLSIDHGGFASWLGHIDQRRVILISDYLISTVRQIGISLESSVIHQANINEKWYSHSHNLRNRLRTEHPNARSFLQLNAAEHRRMVGIDNEIKGFFVESGTILDSLAAAFVGITAIRTPIQEVSWTIVAKAPNWLGQRSKHLEDVDSPGRTVQEDIIKRLHNSIPKSPTDWLQWTLDMRHALVHRGVRMKFTHVSGNRREGASFSYWLPRNPKFSDAEAFARGNNTDDIYIREHAGDVVDIVAANVQRLAIEFLTVLDELWQTRTRVATTLIQPGQQWPSLELTKALRFNGSGTPSPHLPKERYGSILPTHYE